jgi:hypothetical protein
MQKIQTQFNDLKNYLKTKEGELVTKYFNILGYKYTSTILNSNFFHFTTEALLISLGKALNFEFTSTQNIPLSILKASINETDYQENLNTLLGTSDPFENDIKFSIDKISDLFLENFLRERKIVQNSEIFYKSEEFFPVEILEDILRKSVNKSIIDLCGDEDHLLFEIYAELEEKFGQKFGLQEFINAYQSKKENSSDNTSTHNEEDNNKDEKSSDQQDKVQKQNFCYRNICELYYYYAQAKFDDFITDLKSFNQQSTSIIYVIIGIIKYQYLYGMDKVRTLIKYSKVKYELGYDCLSNKLTHGQEFTQKNFNKLRIWVKDSTKTINSGFKERFPSVHGRIVLLNDNYLCPLSMRANAFLFTSYTFVVSHCKTGKDKLVVLNKEIIEFISTHYQISKEKASEYVILTKEKIGNSQIVKISIQKINNSKECFADLLEHVNKRIHELNIQLIINSSQEYAKKGKEYALKGKELVMNRYYKFLGCEETQKEEVEISAVEVDDKNTKSVLY